MKISRNWLKTYFDADIPVADQLTELFTFHSFEVEGVVDIKDEKGKVTDTVLDIKVLPDRAHYALSHQGVALEVSVLTGQELKKNRIPAGPEATMDAQPSITIKDTKFCRRYVGRLVDLGTSGGLASGKYTCAMLEAVGQRAINAIVDATNMVMLDCGQPLHAFDADKVKGGIVVRVAKEGEKITLLDNREITLSASDYLIADDEGPLAIAGVKGGKRAEITSDTKRIIIESANFDPTFVRRTSTKYDLRNDSSKRFENEITAELCPQGMNDVCALLKESFPSAKFGPIVDEYPVKAKQTTIVFNPSYIEERLGVKVPLTEAEQILKHLGIVVYVTSPTSAAPAGENRVSTVAQQHEETRLSPRGRGTSSSVLWNLTIPFNRLDLTIPEDVVDEIGRIYGYDHVKGILPPKPVQPEAIPALFYLSEQIRTILAGEGFSEVSLYSLVENGEVEIAKPLAKDKGFARTNLEGGMSLCLERNALNADLLGLNTIKIFEIGHVFTHAVEETYLVIGVAQIKKVKGLKAQDLVMSALKTLTEKIGTELEVLTSSSAPTSKTSPSNPLRAVVEVNLSQASKTFKAGTAADLHFDRSSNNRYQKFSTYPFITRDIAIFVPESVGESVVWSVIEKGIKDAKSESLLVHHSLFDVFKKEGKTSFAFRLVFQSMDKTLTDEEINLVMEKINAEIKGKNWEVR